MLARESRDIATANADIGKFAPGRPKPPPWPLSPQRQSTSPIFEATECAAIIECWTTLDG
jgi:hypothetical protein